MKRIISLIIVVCALFALVSCGDKKAYEADAKSFSSNGINITLTEAFKETPNESYTAVYDSNEAAVFVLKENFSSFKNENMSLDKYTEFFVEANKDKAPSAVSKENGFPMTEYSFKNEELNKTYKYMTVMLEGTDAYWCVQFVCEESVYEEYKPYFINWAKTVTFAPKA